MDAITFLMHSLAHSGSSQELATQIFKNNSKIVKMMSHLYQLEKKIRYSESEYIVFSIINIDSTYRIYMYISYINNCKKLKY